MNWPWDALGLDGPSSLPEVRRAYAERLKGAHPEEDPEGFQRLHEAYQAARRAARGQACMGTAEIGTDPSPVPDFPVEADGPAPGDPGPVSEGPAPGDPRSVVSGRSAPSIPLGSAPGMEWDYERLFREAEEDRRAADLRAYQVRLLEAAAFLRRVRARHPFLRLRRDRDERRQASRLIALQALFLLTESPEPLGGWRLNCKVLIADEHFQAVKYDELFTACLTAFFREHRELPQTVRDAFFTEYRFASDLRARLWYGPLCRALAGERFRRRWRRDLCLTLWMLSIPALLALWMSVSPPWRVRCAGWLREDLGVEILRSYGWGRAPFTAVWGPDREVVRFLAVRDGTRDLDAGHVGYRTDLTKVLFSREVASFADAQGWEADRAPVRDRDTLDAPEDLFLRLPLTGAGDGITALGDLLASLSGEGWYQALPPDHRLYLCWQGWCFWPYASSDGAFDAEAVRAYYEQDLGPALCTVLARETGAAERDLGPGSYDLSERGAVDLDGGRAFWSVGAADGEERAWYFLSEDGGSLACLPPGTAPLTGELLWSGDPDPCAVPGIDGPILVWDRVSPGGA